MDRYNLSIIVVSSTVDIDDDLRFDPKKQLWEPGDILTTCSSLFTTAASTIKSRDGDT